MDWLKYLKTKVLKRIKDLVFTSLEYWRLMILNPSYSKCVDNQSIVVINGDLHGVLLVSRVRGCLSCRRPDHAVPDVRQDVAAHHQLSIVGPAPQSVAVKQPVESGPAGIIVRFVTRHRVIQAYDTTRFVIWVNIINCISNVCS